MCSYCLCSIISQTWARLSGQNLFSPEDTHKTGLRGNYGALLGTNDELQEGKPRAFSQVQGPSAYGSQETIMLHFMKAGSGRKALEEGVSEGRAWG